jgi:hypothetical protein
LRRYAAGTVSQLVSPPLMQVVCTPLHLLALNLVNAPGATAGLALFTTLLCSQNTSSCHDSRYMSM